MRCSVESCSSDTKYTTKCHGISFHMFPKDPVLRALWAESLGMAGWEPKDRSTICSKHFYDHDFYETFGGRRKIKTGAIPFEMKDSADELNAPAAFRVCRICLAIDTKMYDIRENELDQIYEQVTGVTVSDQDGLPQKLCWECAGRLSSLIKIRSKALRAQTIMMEMLQAGRYITIRDIKSVNRTYNQLRSNLIQKIYESDDYDVHVQDSELVKSELCYDDEGDEEESKETDSVPVIVKVEVKDENYDEIDSFDDTDDEKKLCEVQVDVKPKAKIVKSENDSQSTLVDEQSTTFKNHLRIKHVSACACDLCGYTFVNNYGVEVHKRMMHHFFDTVPPDGPYCEVCEVRFLSDEAFSRHLKLSSKHISEDDPCRFRNKSRRSTTRKKTTVRRVQRRPAIRSRNPADEAKASALLACEQCGVQLPNPRVYTMHFRKEHPDKNRTKFLSRTASCMCDQCGRIFQCLALLQDHMTVHTGEKLFKCERCPKRFAQKTKLVFHMRVHKPQRPSYECPLCGKHFTQPENRRRHMLIHAGVRPYKCETCGKCFTTSTEQRVHSEHVHQKKPWPKRVRSRSKNTKKSPKED